MLITLLSLLTGCATAVKPDVRVETVNVEVPIKCTIVMPDKPILYTKNLTIDSSLLEKGNAHIAENLSRKAYEKEVDVAIAPCIVPLKK